MAKTDSEYVRGYELAIQSQVAEFAEFAKLANDPPQLSYAMRGTLYASPTSGWLLLSVPNALGRGAFDAIAEPGAQLPTSGVSQRYNAHISVIRPEELESKGLTVDDITERGHQFRYTLGPLRTVTPAGWDGISKVWFIEVVSPELEQLRKSYGLTALPKDNEFKFHITVAVRRKGVLQPNELSKAGAAAYFCDAAKVTGVENTTTGVETNPQMESTAKIAAAGQHEINTLAYHGFPPALLGLLGTAYGVGSAPGGSALRGGIAGGLTGAGAGLGYSAADAYLRSPYGASLRESPAISAALLFGALGLGGSAGLRAGRKLTQRLGLGNKDDVYDNDLAAIDPSRIGRSLLPPALQPYAVKTSEDASLGRAAVTAVKPLPAPKRRLSITSLLNLNPTNGSRTTPVRKV